MLMANFLQNLQNTENSNQKTKQLLIIVETIEGLSSNYAQPIHTVCDHANFKNNTLLATLSCGLFLTCRRKIKSKKLQQFMFYE
jgi:hypothetical protein